MRDARIKSHDSRLTNHFSFLCRSGFLWPLGSILGTTLLATLNAHRVESPADDVITNARQVLNAAATYQHNRVLLQVVADARNVSSNLDSISQPNSCHLSQGRVWLLRRLGVDAGANSPLLRTRFQRWAR